MDQEQRPLSACPLPAQTRLMVPSSDMWPHLKHLASPGQARPAGWFQQLTNTPHSLYPLHNPPTSQSGVQSPSHLHTPHSQVTREEVGGRKLSSNIWNNVQCKLIPCSSQQHWEESWEGWRGACHGPGGGVLLLLPLSSALTEVLRKSPLGLLQGFKLRWKMICRNDHSFKMLYSRVKIQSWCDC